MIELAISSDRNATINKAPATEKIPAMKLSIKKPQTAKAVAATIHMTSKVGVTPGRYFGKGGQGYVRMSYASSTEQLQEALKRIAKFVENI